MIDGLLYNWLLEPDAFDLQQSGGQLLQSYLRGLGASKLAASPALAPVRMLSDTIEV